MNDMLQRLSRRLTMDDIEMLCRQAMTDEQAFGELFALAFNPDKRTADNAAWTMTHLPREADKWLAARQQTLIDEAMSVKGATRRRLLLTLLLRTPFEADQLRTDFLDFCLNGMLDDTQPTGVRAICTKLAFNQCRHYPELLSELQATLSMLDPKLLSPGLRSAFKKVAFVAQKLLRHAIFRNFERTFMISLYKGNSKKQGKIGLRIGNPSHFHILQSIASRNTR